MSRLSEAERARGVVAASAGNHAQGVAYHAQRLGLRAVIVMPRLTAGVKVARTQGFGAEVILFGDSLDEAHNHAMALAQAQGLTFVHPFDDPDVIAGQGTCSREFIEQTGGLDMVVAPIGGGGMISGTCLTLSTLAPETKVIAAEPEQADDAYRSFKAGELSVAYCGWG